MAVNPDRINEIMSDFQDKVAGIVRTSGLEHHTNTSSLSNIDSLKNQYLQTVMNAFTLPTTTEGELLSEMDAVVREIERVAKGNQKQKQPKSQQLEQQLTKERQQTLAHGTD